jgi:uncharacterized protein
MAGIKRARSEPCSERFEIDDGGPFDPEAFRAFLIDRRSHGRAHPHRVDMASLSFGRKLLVRVIRTYRRKISPRLRRQCVFEPSCSTYAELAIARNGVFSGLWETWRRLQRCRPENEGKIDYPIGVRSALSSDPNR